MKKILIFLLLLSPSLLFAQKRVEAFLDKAVEKLKADAAVQMNYNYKVYDDEGALTYDDKGVMVLDNDCYSLLMENMKVWCDGSTQWSYMKDIDEVYITEAGSEEAQNLSPIYIMEKYRNSYSLSLKKKGDVSVVTLEARDSEEEVTKVELFIDNGSYLLGRMNIYMEEQGRVEVFLDNYVAKCSFGSDTYTCPVGDFPTAEVIDMR